MPDKAQPAARQPAPPQPASADTRRLHDAAADDASIGSPSLTPSEPTLVELLAYYAQAGFDTDAFVTAEAMLSCGRCSSQLAPGDVEVHSIRRLEGESDPSDMSAVLALVCPVCGAHATAVVRFGPEADPQEVTVWQGIRDRRSSDLLPGGSAPLEDDPGAAPDVPGLAAAQAAASA